MPTSAIQDFAKSNPAFKKVLAGKLSVQDFFTKPEFAESKGKFMSIYYRQFGSRPEQSLYNNESVAAAWIAKLRYNEHMSDDQFKKFIDRSENIFSGKGGELR